jgi:hypothetical protein
MWQSSSCWQSSRESFSINQTYVAIKIVMSVIILMSTPDSNISCEEDYICQLRVIVTYGQMPGITATAKLHSASK